MSTWCCPSASMRSRGDTIAAIATAQGEGGIAIVRISGDGALGALDAVFARGGMPRAKGVACASGSAGNLNADDAASTSDNLRAVDATGASCSADTLSAVVAADAAQKRARWARNRLYYGHVVEDGKIVDEAMAVYMPSPRSYTREDVCEIHCHGGRYAAAKILSLVLKNGARAAQPGEFTLRAFLNGRIDLSRAEAVMQMISAGGEAAARAAARQMEGGLALFVETLSARLTDMLSLIEANIDFPEEVDEQAAVKSILPDVRGMIAQLAKASDERAAQIVRDGLTVAIAGAPNAGKSSLMNALLRSDRAIVTSVAGTTRDVLAERLRVGGQDLTLLDTAGLRETRDEIEREGVLRARRAIDTADAVLLVLDGSVCEGEEERALQKNMDERYIVLLNKCDLGAAPGRRGLPISAKTGEGVEGVLSMLLARAKRSDGSEQLLTMPRHIDCAKRAMQALEMAQEGLAGGAPLDMVSVDLTEALSALCEIVGKDASDEVISAVFRNFCVGK
jgi:tRNA modification GTPase